MTHHKGTKYTKVEAGVNSIWSPTTRDFVPFVSLWFELSEIQALLLMLVLHKHIFQKRGQGIFEPTSANKLCVGIQFDRQQFFF